MSSKFPWIKNGLNGICKDADNSQFQKGLIYIIEPDKELCEFTNQQYADVYELCTGEYLGHYDCERFTLFG